MSATKFPRHSARGAASLIERMPNGLAARWLYPAYFVCAEGTLAGDAAECSLHQAFENGKFKAVRSLRWNEPIDEVNCWYSTPLWSLSLAELDGEQGPTRI